MFPERSKLPIQHPDYLYPPSSNPYAAKALAHAGLIFHDNATEEHRGKWRSCFPGGGEGKPLVVELGCNGGHVVLEWAARDPKSLFLGVDWKVKQVVFGAEKAKKRKIENVLFLRGTVERFQFMFGDGEIDRLAMYFPDPWEKKSEKKNRTLNRDSFRVYAAKLKPGTGIFHIKTDHAEYFDWICEALEPNLDLWEIVEQTRDLHAGNPRAAELTIPDVTLFERLFIKDGLPIHSLVLRRK